MSSFKVIVVICALLAPCLLAEKSKPCYDYEAGHKEIKGICLACKKASKWNKTELYRCINENMKVADEKGNIVPKKIRELYLENLVDRKKLKALKDATRDCVKGVKPIKLTSETREDVSKVWTCIDEAMMTVCPEAAAHAEIMNHDPALKGCMGD